MRKIILFSLLITVLNTVNLNAQSTLPTLYNLNVGGYVFNQWDSLATAGTYPENMKFHFTNDPSSKSFKSDTDGTADFACAYNLKARNRIKGLGSKGFSFLATGSAQYNNCASGTAANSRFVGAALIGLNATNRSGINVNYQAQLVTPAALSGSATVKRQFAVRLQYKVGAAGSFKSVVNANGDTVQYNSKGQDSLAVVTVNGTLPAECNNQAELYVRLIYFQVNNPADTGTVGGSRPEIAINKIQIGSQPLPVTLSKFGAMAVGVDALLGWSTATELNVSRFELEKSKDGNVFTAIASIAALNHVNGSAYNFLDKNLSVGVQYYRLKMIDKDGSYAYSSVITLNNNKLNKLIVTNPIIGNLVKVQHGAITGSNASIRIVSTTGVVVLSQKVATGSMLTNVDVKGIQKGNYLLVIQDDNSKQVRQILLP